MSAGVKAKYVFLAFVPYLIIYFLIQSIITVNHYDLLSLTDTQIPFIPEFIWVYHTIIPVTVVTCFILFQKKDLFLSMIYSNIIAGIILCLFYIFFPSFYPRPEIVDTGGLSNALVELTRAIDGAHNTFPSGHVTFSWMLAFYVGLSQKGKQHSMLKYAYFCWAILISISTLTLKQHYLIDVVSGVALAGIIFYIFKNVYLFRPTEKLITIDDKIVSTRSVPKEVPIDC
jgi:membrane-associated phospholipid phosphatase